MMKTFFIALFLLATLGSGAYLWVMARANQALIHQLAGAYAAQIYRQNDAPVWQRLGPLKIAELLTQATPKEVQDLVAPLKVAAIVHASLSALTLLLILVTW
jgi:hypothetical protein